jgi:hypothetical protein
MERLKQIALQQRGTQALSDPDVAMALDLKPDQKRQIRDIQDAASKANGGFCAEGRPFGWGQEAGERARQTNQRLLAVLTAHQRDLWDKMIGKEFKGPIWPPFRGPGLRRDVPPHMKGPGRTGPPEDGPQFGPRNRGGR